jgi:ATP-binding cassette subfamily F protein 3
MRAVLASLLFQQPDLLLMDEPTNHLDMPSVAWLSEFLQRYPRAFVLISHDREFLNEQIARVVSFEPEGVRLYSGNYDQYVRQRAEEERVLENKAKNLERERERMEKFVERFKAKATKARQASSRQKQLDRMEEVETLELRKTMKIKFPPVPRTVAEVVRTQGLRKVYGDHVVLDDVALRVQRGDRIAIIGANGAGKTTLLKILAGELSATAGEVTIGSDVAVGYYAQHHAEMLHGESTVLEEVSRSTRALPARVRAVLGAFLFSGDDVDKPIAVLSGGERARVALARLLVEPGSLLLMDEPTNHLDLASSEALAESLAETYGGTLVFVSHNRAFVRRLATTIWNVEHGHVEEYPGTLDEYMDSCRRRLEAAERASARAEAEPRLAPAKTAPKAARPTEPPPDELDQAGKRSREDDKARKRREAELRQQRSKKLKPLERKVAELEDRIAMLEAEQKERGSLLSDPAVYADAKRRDGLLADYQSTQDKLDELTARWEAAVEALEVAEAELATALEG